MTSRIGVFICDCKGLISDYLDTSRIAEQASGLPGVAFVSTEEMMCGEQQLGLAVRKLVDNQCDRMLFVGCSPRSSLKFPEERIARVMQGLSLSPELFEVANIREQCAWQHSDREMATGKAVDLMRMAHAKLLLDSPALRAVAIPKNALVVGAGPTGLQTAKDLAAAGIKVTLTERNPWIGGHLCQLHRIFQSEGWPSICDGSCVGPVQAKGALLSDGVEALTQTRVTAVEKLNGAFRVTLSSEPQYVNPDLCISCHKCAEVCPVETPRRSDQCLSSRKAIDKEFERALPDLYTIERSACTMCGDCVPVCPTNAIDLHRKQRATTKEFGAVFLATGFNHLDLSGYEEYQSTHPNVVTALEFERLMAKGLRRPSDGEEPEQVVFIQCAGSRAGPDKQSKGVSYCSKTCCSVTAKQVDRLLVSNPMVEPTVVYYRDMRTYERALEELNQKIAMSGVELINGEVTSLVSDKNGSFEITVEPIQLESDDDDKEEQEEEAKKLEADLVVLAAAETPAEGAHELFRMFGVETDRYGYPVENQPRLFRPTESLVNRVYVVGSSSGPKVVQQASEQGSAAAMRALPSLMKGSVEPLRYASRVNPDSCIKCRACESVCPHGAIRMTEEGAVSDPAFCQACGFCAAACPSHAAELDNFTDRQILDQIKVAFTSLPEEEPKIVALLCYWCSYSAADFAGIERNTAPVNYRVIRIRCSSSVSTALITEMFKLGVDGILVAGCPEKSCHHLWGNFVADKRIELARTLLGQLGLEQGRLRFEYIGAPMHVKLVDTLNKMNTTLKKLGPNPASVAWATRREEMASWRTS